MSYLLLVVAACYLYALYRWGRHADPDPPHVSQLRRRQLDNIDEVER